jgi:hypothetical protein
MRLVDRDPYFVGGVTPKSLKDQELHCGKRHPFGHCELWICERRAGARKEARKGTILQHVVDCRVGVEGDGHDDARIEVLTRRPGSCRRAWPASA